VEEHRQILEMVAEGKITVEEGTRLLDALRASPSEEPDHVEVHHVPGGEILSAISHAIAGDTARRVRRTRRVRTRPGRSVDRIVSFASHGISPDYVRDMQTVLDDISGEELVTLSSSGVSPDYVEELKEAFGGDVDVHEIVSLAAMGIAADYVEEIREALGDEVGVGEIISLSSMGVSAAYVEEIKEALGDDVSVGDIISLSSMGVSAKYIEDLHEAGLASPTVKDVMRRKLDT